MSCYNMILVYGAHIITIKYKNALETICITPSLHVCAVIIPHKVFVSCILNNMSDMRSWRIIRITMLHEGSTSST